MSFVELDEHPRKFALMNIAFTTQKGINDGNALIQAKFDQRAKLNGNT